MFVITLMNLSEKNDGNYEKCSNLSAITLNKKPSSQNGGLTERSMTYYELKKTSLLNEIDVKLSAEEVELAKNLTMLFHVNVIDDHITVEEEKPGKASRIFNIYIRQSGNGEFRLWCEYDNSYECWHVKTAWTYPHVQKMMMHYKDKTKPCGHCKTVNDSDALFCKRCGVKLE